MKLRDTVEVWFSELDDNWEVCDMYWFSWTSDQRKCEQYRRYGDLPDGRHFGAGFIPAFGDPWGRESAIVIVGEDGDLQLDTLSFIEKWGSFPTAMALSPSGRTLVWLTVDHQLGVWTQEKEGFTDWDGKSLNKRLGDRTIVDVKLHADGIMEIKFKGGETAGYLYDADVVLEPWKSGWTPAAGESGNLSYALNNGYLHTCPDSIYVRIGEDDYWGAYAGGGIKKVLFDNGLQRIEGEILADNPELETVVIPASVRYVDWHAFGGCTSLKNLVIEGDLSRVKQWNKDAFEGCPCEDYYDRIVLGTEPAIKTALGQCSNDDVLYGIACYSGDDPDMISGRDKAARMIRNRDYQYALSSHIQNRARTAMILNLYDTLEGDELFIARTILTDPNDNNKAHMLLFCKYEELLMLGWRHVYGERKYCADRLHAMGSRFPEAYEEMNPQERIECEQEWIEFAAETAYMDILPEDEAVRGRISASATVDSEPLHLFLSIHHPRKAVRWWYARKLKNPVYIAYVGSWTSDDQIKEALSVKINSTALITEMIFGDLSGADLVFAFRKPEDLTLQDRFCVEIMKNHPDRTIREHVRTELLRGNVDIPGVDLSKPDPLYRR